MYSMVVNTSHPIINKIIDDKNKQLATELQEIDKKIEPLNQEVEKIKEEQKKKKEEEITTTEKDELNEKEKQLETLRNERKHKLETFGANNTTVKQLIDIALLSHNLLKGEAFSRFIKRSVKVLTQN